MFKFLKDKIKKWTKKVHKEKAIEESEKKLKEKPKKTKTPKKGKKEDIKEIEIPLKLDSIAITGVRTPDTEKLEEIKKELEKKSPSQEQESPEKKGFFSKLKEKFSHTIISEKDFEEYSEELEMILLENNVALGVSDKIIEPLKQKIVGKEIEKQELEKEISESLKKTIEEVLIEPFNLVEEIASLKQEGKPYVILFCGINGSGKTTTLAKLAHKLKKKKLKSVLAAADTFRAAAIDQLKTHGEKLKIPVIAHEYGSDPASVGFDAIQYAKKHNIDVVLIDTAGRMYTDKNLMQEIKKIARVCKPNLKIFVGESISGNDSTEQAKAFNEAVEIDAIILSKADIDEKGGTALSVGQVTNKPIIYLGTGQEYDKLEEFNKKDFIKKLGL